MEILCKNTPHVPVKAVLFDFDGTVSTLRCGWENVMQPMFCEMLAGKDGVTEELRKKVSDYISESTGIQTILQMKWLKSEVEKAGLASLDIWDYKKIYNDRLMCDIKKKLSKLDGGDERPESYLMAGAVGFLTELKDRGVKIYVASGTDHPDVINEAKALGVYGLFDEIKGAPVHEESCSKEAVIKMLIEENGLCGDDFAVCGDGKVEIALGKAAGARAIGLASCEKERHGVDPVKRERLIKAGADIITGDFLDKDGIFDFLGL